MPEKYHIKTRPVPPRRPRLGKHGVVDWREDCARCHNCVKKACVYDRYAQEVDYIRKLTEVEALYFDCMGCFSCVQDCTKGLLCLSVNPVYEKLGNSYWKPDIIKTTWLQAETAKIPVSGAGYRGPFSGHGFDSMWTDMSEIVRPTRDGIHGREYISTSVDLGAKPMRLEFGADGAVKNGAALLELQMPVILEAAPWGDPSGAFLEARISAAAALRTLAVVPAKHLQAVTEEQRRFVVPLFESGEALPPKDALSQVRMVEIADGPSGFSLAKELQGDDRRLLVAVRMPLRPGAAKRVLELHQSGISLIHLCADYHGREWHGQVPLPAREERGTGSQQQTKAARGITERPRFVKDVLREIHGALVQRGLRDAVTLIASGGIALPEHVAKAIICGADLVGVDIPLLVALGCRVCAGRHKAACPANIAEAEADYAAQRMVNLMGAWHSQLIEVLGAMGLREIRRLRGEAGRAMFQEDLERDAFKDLARGLEGAAEVAEPDRQPVLSEPKEQAVLGIHR